MNSDKDKTVVSESAEQSKTQAAQKIGHYEVIAELGRGGMGTVYRGYESSLNRYVAIKVLAPHLADDQSLVGRFSREAKSVAALNHPNVVHIYYTGEQDGLPYFVMECIEGETLADRVREKGSLPSKEAARILLQAAKGLASAHDRGIIHRDVKPSNLMIDASGTVKLTDFGIALARDIGDKLTTTGQFVGTTGYVSPEVFQGRPVDSRSDIFSLGVVLFEMLAGVKPFDDDSPMGLMLQVVEKPAPEIRELSPGVDERLRTILQRMIEKNPDDRYQTCHELIADLNRYLAGEPLEGEGVAAESPPSEPRRKVWPLVLLVLLGAVGAAAYTWREPLLALLPQGEAPPVTAQAADTADAAEVTQVPGEPPVVESGSGAGAPPAGPDSSAAGEVQAGEHPVLPDGEQDSFDPGELTDSTPNPGAAGTAPDATAPAVPVSPVAAATRLGAAEPAAAVEPPRAAVVALRGDPALVGPLAQRIDEALQSEDLDRLDAAFVPGAARALQALPPDLYALKEPLMAAGGRYLVLVTASDLGSESIEYYGQRDTLYSAQVELALYDLPQGRALQRWSERVSYTNLNAAERVESAFAGHLATMVGLMDKP